MYVRHDLPPALFTVLQALILGLRGRGAFPIALTSRGDIIYLGESMLSGQRPTAVFSGLWLKCRFWHS